MTNLSKKAVRGILVLSALAGFTVGAACADDRRDAGREEHREMGRDRDHGVRHETEVVRVPPRHEPYRAPHWIYDDRHRHHHYYPAVGYAVEVLPPGFVTLGFASRRFFFQGGVWFEPLGGGFAVVRPPLGIVVPALPPDYSTVWAGGVPYYYANDTYYVSSPDGYAVTNPPAGMTSDAGPAAAPTAAPPPSGATWYYCDSARAYYPYVSTCSEGWRAVPASAPPQ